MKKGVRFSGRHEFLSPAQNGIEYHGRLIILLSWMNTDSTVRKRDSTSRCYLGIDFSGNFRMWSAGCRKTNVWIAELESGASRPALVDLIPVQQLRGDHPDPFTRLVQRLRQRTFDAAAIDAPFSIPKQYLRPKKHRQLLEQVGTLDLPHGRPFPSAAAFLDCVLGGKKPTTPKPLRETEECWRHLNVRSTLWHGPRSGAPMTAACLKLLWEAGSPLWPWENSGRGLLVEAFPAAQLYRWHLPHQGYNGKGESQEKNRCLIVRRIVEQIDLGHFAKELEQCADAIDAVVCAFAAMAVIDNLDLCCHIGAADEEGRIAVAA